MKTRHANILNHLTVGPENPTRAALPAMFLAPDVLVRLSQEHDRMFTS